MADSSFDIVSKFDRQEVDNALGQTAREIATRFDFKGTGATIEVWQLLLGLGVLLAGLVLMLGGRRRREEDNA